MLIQVAAHEEANIIFGAVIDDEVPEGELRVTVIATGLEDERRRKTPPNRASNDLATTSLEIQHVTSSQSVPAVDLEPLTSLQQIQSQADGEPESVEGEFSSPFDDELDTPAFLRRAQD